MKSASLYAQDYIKESDNLVLLHDQIRDCDNILSQMETLLCGFQVICCDTRETCLPLFTILKLLFVFLLFFLDYLLSN
jgi:Vps52 / Sac2 family